MRGDLGVSYRRGKPILPELWQHLPETLLGAGASLALAALMGIPLGIMAAVWHGSLPDGLSRLLALLGAVVPSYVLALLPGSGSDLPSAGPSTAFWPAVA
jgi:peptide/nickel transport system permease protein